MIAIVAKFQVKEGAEDKFLALIDELGKASNAEEGCVEYILHKDTKKASTFCLIEKWKDQAAVDFHNDTPHFTTIVPQIGEIAQVEIDLYETV